jgi:hypothetical protein
MALEDRGKLMSVLNQVAKPIKAQFFLSSLIEAIDID